jgi:hypothetical protein
MNDDYHLPNSELGDKRSRDTGPCNDALRDRFAVLRREEEEHMPEFASLWRGRTRAPGGKARWFLAGACALIVVVAVLWPRSAQRRPAGVSVASIAEWKAPTDFLLETPGWELLRTVPEIGEWRGYTAAIPPTRPSQVKKKVSHTKGGRT